MKDKTRKLIYGILALLVSIGAWAFVVYNYYPMTDIKYNDIPLHFIGERALAERGLAISEADTENLSVTLNQKRVDVNRIATEDIEASLDVSECVAGENKVSPSISSPRDTSVADYSKKSVLVNVERTASEYMDVDVIYSGDTPDNAMPIVSDFTQVQAEVVCAASKLSDVKRIAAVLDYQEVGKEPKSFTANLVALDADGKEVPHAVIYPDEISIDASAGIVKKVKLNVPVTNGNTEQYERKYSAPEEITILGPEDVVSKIDTVNAQELDVSYYYEDAELAVTCELPEGVQIAPGTDEPVLKLTVKKKATKDSEEDKE